MDFSVFKKRKFMFFMFLKKCDDKRPYEDPSASGGAQASFQRRSTKIAWSIFVKEPINHLSRLWDPLTWTSGLSIISKPWAMQYSCYGAESSPGHLRRQRDHHTAVCNRMSEKNPKNVDFRASKYEKFMFLGFPQKM